MYNQWRHPKNLTTGSVDRVGCELYYGEGKERCNMKYTERKYDIFLLKLH